MVEERLDRIENLLTQLVSQVASIMETQTEMKIEQKEMRNDINALQTEQKEMRNDITSMQDKLNDIESTSEKRHRKVMDQLHLIRVDQDHIWEKVVHNERNIAILEGKVDLQYTVSSEKKGKTT